MGKEKRKKGNDACVAPEGNESKVLLIAVSAINAAANVARAVKEWWLA